MSEQPNPYAHLGPYEKAARVYLQREGQDPDKLIRRSHPLFPDVELHDPLWFDIAEQMLDLSRLLSAMKAAQKEDGPKIEVTR